MSFNKYAEKLGQTISKFLIGKLVDGKPQVVMPKCHKITQSSSDPGRTMAEGELVYFYEGAIITLNFKIEGTDFVRQLSKELR